VLLTSQSDERLVALARAGHERAFTAIVERYRPELYALARRLSSEGNGEDVVQQAFLGAFAALRAGAEVQHLRGWLYQIVRNVAARSRAPKSVPLDGSTESGEAVEDLVEQRALAIGALAELARLPSRQREAIVGTALDGRARADVARSMGVSEGAVRQLIHRARARLRTVVTAVTPWPLARWLPGGPSGGRNAAEVMAGAGAGVASSGGFVGLKVGIVLASGAIATGVAAVDIHGSRPAAPRPIERAAAGAGHQRAADRRVRTVEAAAVRAEPAAGIRASAAAVVYIAAVRSSRTTTAAAALTRRGRKSGNDVRPAERPVRHEGGAGSRRGGGGGASGGDGRHGPGGGVSGGAGHGGDGSGGAVSGGAGHGGDGSGGDAGSGSGGGDGGQRVSATAASDGRPASVKSPGDGWSVPAQASSDGPRVPASAPGDGGPVWAQTPSDGSSTAAQASSEGSPVSSQSSSNDFNH
jgi:RNA polymerase sigma factor (sigma-70 family)